MEELLIGLGLWFLFRRKKQEEVIKSDEYTPSTGNAIVTGKHKSG